MPEKPFVINDRRKFTAEGDLRPDAEPRSATATLEPDTEPGRSSDEPAAEPGKPHKEPIAFPSSSPTSPAIEPGRSDDEPDSEDEPDEPLPAARTHETIAFPGGDPAPPEAQTANDDGSDPALPPLNAEQIEQAARAYAATVERLNTALRANNLGAEPMPEMTFERLVQSLYMQALLQLGGAAEPGQAPQVDLLGARQTIDMLALIAGKSTGNLSETENQFVQSALFEIRMGFLEVTQALARQAAARHPGGVGASLQKGPGIVR